MAATIELIAHEALALPEPERATLAKTLLQSLESAPESNVEAAWDEEVAIRLERVRQGTAHGRPAVEVFRDIRTRYRE